MKLRSFVALTPLLALAAPASALQMAVTRPQLCAVADAVVLGRVIDMETLWAATAEGGVERHAFVETFQVARGAPAATYEVVLPGGTIGKLRHWVEDVPKLEIDSAYMLFLARTPEGWQVIGGEAGAVPLFAPRPGDDGLFGKGEIPQDAIASLGACNAR